MITEERKETLQPFIELLESLVKYYRWQFSFKKKNGYFALDDKETLQRIEKNRQQANKIFETDYKLDLHDPIQLVSDLTNIEVKMLGLKKDNGI